MTLVLFRWAFHSHLALPDEAAFFATVSGRTATIRCLTREGARLFSYSHDDYSWLSRTDLSYKIVLTNEKTGERTVFREIHIRDNKDSFSGGSVDLLRYAVVEIGTEISGREVLEDQTQFEELQHWAATTLQLFVDWYRLITNEPDVPRPRLSDSPVVEIWIADEYTMSRLGIEANLVLHRRTINWRDPISTGRTKALLSQDGVLRLQHAMEAGAPVPLPEQLLLEAKELAHVHKNFELSIIVAETALEVLIRLELQLACKRKRIFRLPFGTGKRQKHIEYVKAIESGRLREDLLGRYPEILSGVNLRTTREYSLWLDRAYRPRNQVIHGGIRGLDEGAARNAFEAVVAFGNRIRTALATGA